MKLIVIYLEHILINLLAKGNVYLILELLFKCNKDTVSLHKRIYLVLYRQINHYCDRKYLINQKNIFCIKSRKFRDSDNHCLAELRYYGDIDIFITNAIGNSY